MKQDKGLFSSANIFQIVDVVFSSCIIAVLDMLLAESSPFSPRQVTGMFHAFVLTTTTTQFSRLTL